MEDWSILDLIRDRQSGSDNLFQDLALDRTLLQRVEQEGGQFPASSSSTAVR